MAEQDSAPGGDLDQIARIVRSYVRHHQLGPEQLVELIRQVHRALASLGQAALPMAEVRQPAVPIRQSVRPEYVVCLEWGFRAKILRRHLRVQHGLSVDEYRACWNLRSDYSVIAPAYSRRRTAMAKEMGLGRRRRSVEPAAPVRRGRRRRPTTEQGDTVLETPRVRGKEEILTVVTAARRLGLRWKRYPPYRGPLAAAVVLWSLTAANLSASWPFHLLWERRFSGLSFIGWSN